MWYPNFFFHICAYSVNTALLYTEINNKHNTACGRNIFQSSTRAAVHHHEMQPPARSFHQTIKIYISHCPFFSPLLANTQADRPDRFLVCPQMLRRLGLGDKWKKHTVTPKPYPQGVNGSSRQWTALFTERQACSKQWRRLQPQISE